MLGEHGPRDGVDLRRVGEVQGVEVHMTPEALGVGRELGRDSAAAEDDDVRARLQERGGDPAAEAASAAGDGGGPPGEVECAAHASACPSRGVTRTLRQSCPVVAAANAATASSTVKALVGNFSRPSTPEAMSSMARVTSGVV